MTAFDTTFGEQPLVEQKTSGLAIASLVCSLIVCCPLTTLIGPFLGLAAVFTIGSNPARKGKGIAMAGIIIGITVTVGWGMLTVWAHENINVPVQEGPVEVMSAGFSGDISGFRMGLMGEAANGSDEEIQAFVDSLRSRYGEFVSCEMDEVELNSNPPSFDDLMQPVKIYPYLLRFENATVKARIEFATQDPLTGKFLWGTKFGTILVLDENLGDLSYPADSSVDIAVPTEADPAETESDTGNGN